MQPLRDLLVAQALGGGLEDLPLAPGELLDVRAGLALLLAVLAGDAEHLDELPGREQGLALRDTPGGVQDLIHVGGLVNDTRRPRLDGPGVIRPVRSEERRVGKECRSRWSPYH